MTRRAEMALAGFRWEAALMKFLLLLVLTVGVAGSAYAQRNPLFNSAALLRASKGSERGSSSFSDQGPFGFAFNSMSGGEFQLDTVDDLVLVKEKQNVYASQYRSYFYSRYVNDIHPSMDIEDEEEMSQISQRLAAYQMAVNLSDIAMRSPIGNFYRDMIDRLGNARNYITLRVRRKGGGELSFGNSGPRDTQLLEFKVNANTRNGIEPRLRLIENFLLKYDSFAGGPILEYNLNF